MPAACSEDISDFLRTASGIWGAIVLQHRTSKSRKLPGLEQRASDVVELHRRLLRMVAESFRE